MTGPDPDRVAFLTRVDLATMTIDGRPLTEAERQMFGAATPDDVEAAASALETKATLTETEQAWAGELALLMRTHGAYDHEPLNDALDRMPAAAADRARELAALLSTPDAEGPVVTGRDPMEQEGTAVAPTQEFVDREIAVAQLMYDRAVDLTEGLVRSQGESGEPTDELVSLLAALRSLGPEQGLPLFAALADAGRRVLDEVSGSTDDTEERS